MQEFAEATLACALAAKILRQGFYWPAMIDDAAKLVSNFKACQIFSHRSKFAAQPSQLIAPSWPLQRWGIDIVSKLTNTRKLHVRRSSSGIFHQVD
jgi:hypothetical protein